MPYTLNEPLLKDSLASFIKKYWYPSLYSLISEEGYRRVDKLGQRIPMDVTSFWGYEIPLSVDERSADFLFCVHNASLFRQALLYDQPHCQQWLDASIYAALKDISMAWVDRDSNLGKVIANIWFEYDYKDLAKEYPPANFFYAPKQHCHPLEVVWATQRILTLIFQKHIAKTTFSFLTECMHRLPGNGWVSQIGMMLARGEDRLRLFIQQIDNKALLPYLESIGYPYARNADLCQQLHLCDTLASRTDLDIDISDTIGDKIGLECYFDSIEQALHFLDQLYEHHLCTEHKYHGIQAYMKQIQFDVHQRFQHFFSHIKLVYDPHTGFTSKAYLGFVASTLARNIIRTKPLSHYSHEPT
jgi:hypothetical protein